MFYSILYPAEAQHRQARHTAEPDYFKDLSLDQIFSSILMKDKDYWVKGKNETGLESFYYTPLTDPAVITYRQEVMKALEDDGLRGLLTDFADTLGSIHSFLGMVHDGMTSLESWRDNYLTRGQLLDCAERYCLVLSRLSEGLAKKQPDSAGLRDFAEYLKTYTASAVFMTMHDHVSRLRGRFSEVEICMLIRDENLRIRPYEEQEDLASDLKAVFSRFCPESDEWESRLRIPETIMDPRMGATILGMLAKLYKDTFADFDAFCAKYDAFEDETILRFTREIRFYLLWLELIEPMRQNGLPFCYPKLCAGESLYARGIFDLSLAYKKSLKHETVIPNDFELRAPERILVVTGANQGGKTTFARAFGQAHHLAALGLCVPGREAALCLFDQILTHFEREETLMTQSGKLQEDLIRLKALLDKATNRSVVIINEIFASTTLTDALSLGMRMMEALVARGAPALIVTFLDELAGYGPETVSMMSTVSAEDPGERTYKILRKPPDGLAYAIHLAGKYGLTYEQLSEAYKHED
jgi:DNA mismatch repair ATPase MutS